MVRDRMRGLGRRLRALVRRREAEREMDEELAFHIERATEQNLSRGLSAEEARRAALVEFGGVDRYRERARDGRRLAWLEDLLGDAVHALRSSKRQPVFALVAIATVALGVGANSALFGLVSALAFRLPAGVTAGDDLVRVDQAGPIEELSYADYVDLHEAAADQVDLAASMSVGMAMVIGDGEAQRVRGQLVSGNWFGVLGVRPEVGRPILVDDDRPGAPGVVVISHRLFRDRFGADPAAVGTDVRINGHPFTIAGVAPAGFRGLTIEEPADVWAPLSAQPLASPGSDRVLASRTWQAFGVIGRLEEGPDGLSRATVAVTGAAAAIDPLEPDRFRPLRPEVVPLRGYVRADRLRGIMSPLAVAGTITVLVLLVACANVANLQLSRAVARRREIGIRVAIGAGRGRLVRLLLAESLVLALCAVPAGILLAHAGASLFESRFAGPLAPLSVAPDRLVLAFTVALALFTGIAFGLAPALRASRTDVTALLGSGRDGPPGRLRLQRALVITQLAASLVLLVCAGLFLRRVQAATEVQPGYDADRVLAVSLDLFSRGYDTDASDVFHERLRAALRDVPGIEAVSSPGYAPFSGAAALMRATRPSNGMQAAVVAMAVAPDWFRTLGITPLRGRVIDNRDLAADANVAVVSATLARRLASSGDAIGARLSLDGHDEPMRIIGVVPDIVAHDLHEREQAQLFLPYTVHFRMAETALLVRTPAPDAVLPRIRAEVRRLDPHVAVFGERTLASALDEALAYSRGIARVIAALGALALALAALGLYGVMAFTVAGRTREIGIRIALGARPAALVRRLTTEGLRLAGVGLLIGGVLAFAFGRVLAGIIEGIRATDPAAAVLAAGVLLSVAGLASWLPARRAARVEPQSALRTD